MHVRIARWTYLGSTLLLACGSGWDESPPTVAVTATESSALTAQQVEPYAQQVDWNGTAFSGTVGTFYADVTGNGTADAIALNSNGISVRTSGGSPPLNQPTSWLSVAFVGSQGNFFADVNNDNKADAIALNSANILVRKAGNSSFGASETWSTSGFSGSVRTFVADVTGDSRADVIAINGANIQVRAANGTGTGFNAATTWSSSTFSGTVGTYAADVTGDGKADLVAVDSQSISVRVSSGTAFGNSTTFSSSGFSGTRGTFVADVTGDKVADIVAVNDNDIRMRRSSRWFFATNVEVMSTAATASTVTRTLADLTGDGRADYVERTSANIIQARSRQDRVVPVRIVQFVDDCAGVHSDSQIQANLDAANAVHQLAAGIKFVAQPVTTNPDCPGFTKSHVVRSHVLAHLTNAYSASQAELEKAKNPYNPSCDIGYSDFADLGYGVQLWWVGARCALPGEVLVNVATNEVEPGYSNGTPAGDGSLVFLDNGAFSPSAGIWGHELGHYLGIEHSMAFGYGGPLYGYVDPDTGQAQTMAAWWDLVHAGSTYFNSRTEAAAQETSLAPIEYPIANGWYCPSSDPAKPCPFDTLVGGNPPPGTLGIPVTGDMNNLIYTYLPQSTTFNIRMKGIAPRAANNLPATNLMAYRYPAQPPTVQYGLSLSQTQVIQKNLSKDVLTKFLDAEGRVIFGRRPALGITGATPAQLTYMQAGNATARSGPGTIASNSLNVYAVSTNFHGVNTGYHVIRWDHRLRQWNQIGAGAYQVALPSGGADQPWAIVGGEAGPVKRWNGVAFESLPADPNGTCARSLAVGDHISGQYAWAISCVGPNFDGNYRVMRYSDAAGWIFYGTPATDGYGLEMAVDWQGVPWVRAQYASGFGSVFKANITPQGELVGWIQVPHTSSVLQLTGGAVSNGTRLPVNMVSSDGHIYTLKKSTNTWTDAGAPPFGVGEAGGALPYLWLVNSATGGIFYAR